MAFQRQYSRNRANGTSTPRLPVSCIWSYTIICFCISTAPPGNPKTRRPRTITRKSPSTSSTVSTAPVDASTVAAVASSYQARVAFCKGVSSGAALVALLISPFVASHLAAETSGATPTNTSENNTDDNCRISTDLDGRSDDSDASCDHETGRVGGRHIGRHIRRRPTGQDNGGAGEMPTCPEGDRLEMRVGNSCSETCEPAALREDLEAEGPSLEDSKATRVIGTT